MGDADRQDALSDVVEMAELLHSLRGLTGEVEGLLADAMRIAHGAGVSQAVIADAAALTPGRVSQVIAAGERPASTEATHDRWHAIREWPGDALRRHRSSFSGRMTFPPYGRRRS
jgi:hypothetical protein